MAIKTVASTQSAWDNVVNSYFILVKAGLMPIENVPEKFRADVQKKLDEYYASKG